MWVPPEDVDPILLHAPTRESLGVFGAVSVADGRLVTRCAAKFEAITSLDFLQMLLRHRRRNRRMWLVVDNATWHRAQWLRPWLEDHRHVFHLDFLPPYSPELNSMERVWKLTRRLRTHNRHFPVLDELLEAVCDQFYEWRAPNSILRRLCAVI